MYNNKVVNAGIHQSCRLLEDCSCRILARRFLHFREKVYLGIKNTDAFLVSFYRTDDQFLLRTRWEEKSDDDSRDVYSYFFRKRDCYILFAKDVVCTSTLFCRGFFQRPKLILKCVCVNIFIVAKRLHNTNFQFKEKKISPKNILEFRNFFYDFIFLFHIEKLISGRFLIGTEIKCVTTKNVKIDSLYLTNTIYDIVLRCCETVLCGAYRYDFLSLHIFITSHEYFNRKHKIYAETKRTNIFMYIFVFNTVKFLRKSYDILIRRQDKFISLDISFTNE